MEAMNYDRFLPDAPAMRLPRVRFTISRAMITIFLVSTSLGVYRLRRDMAEQARATVVSKMKYLKLKAERESMERAERGYVETAQMLELRRREDERWWELRGQESEKLKTEIEILERETRELFGPTRGQEPHVQNAEKTRREMLWRQEQEDDRVLLRGPTGRPRGEIGQAGSGESTRPKGNTASSDAALELFKSEIEKVRAAERSAKADFEREALRLDSVQRWARFLPF
jgi:hypothetical protein